MAFNYLLARHEALNPLSRPYASPAYYEVYFNAPPPCMTEDGKTSLLDDIIELGSNILFGDPSSIRFRVKGVDLPQRQLETQPRFAEGPMRLMPYGLVYSTMNMEIVESDQYKIRQFFEEWHTKIFSNKNNYGVEYYDRLVADKLTIVAFASSGIPTRIWEMKEAYPIAINTSQMSWDAQNQYLVINIELAFHEWESREPTVADYANVAIDAAQGEVARQIGNIL